MQGKQQVAEPWQGSMTFNPYRVVVKSYILPAGFAGVIQFKSLRDFEC